jgi:AbrB family looped-hinge helix DNA binding protein
MQSVIMSTKGQIIIPADIRKKYGLKKGEKLIIEDEDGYIKMIPRTDITKLCGTWKDLDHKTIRKQIEEMRKDWR